MLATKTSTSPVLVEISEAQSDVPFTAVCTPGTGMELSLAPLQKPEDAAKSAGLDLCMKLHTILHPHGAERLLAPTPTEANGEIIEPTNLSKVFLVGSGMRMFRNPEAPADGTFLRNRGDAGIFSVSGCGVIVAAMGDRLIFAHAARNSLIDRRRVLTGQNSRRNESVVDAIIEAFGELGHDKFDIKIRMRVWMFYFIRPEDLFDSFDNPEHCKYNRAVGADVQNRLGVHRMYNDDGVMLDLPVIAAQQFVNHGISRRNINLEHCYLPGGMPHTRNGGGRSLLAIIRR